MRTRRTGQLAVWIATLLLTLWALLRLGQGALGTPPLGSLTEMRIWLDGSGLAVGTFAFVRLLAVAVTLYLLATTIFSVVARLSRASDLIYLADRISVPVVRKMVSGTASISITAGTLAGAALPVTGTLLIDQRPDLQVVSLAAHDSVADSPANAASEQLVSRHTADPSATHPLAIDEPAQMVVLPDNIEPELNAETGPSGEDTWLVAPGDHLWSIAERTLALEFATEPDQDAVFNYWRALVRVNQDRLVNTDNPDLILPGQELLLPTIGG